jgi:meiotically up-regulated gene 157 (Mug157) protein
MARVYSPFNNYYFSGSDLTGLGSPHTPANYVWPLATAMEALTSSNATRQAGLLKVG